MQDFGYDVAACSDADSRCGTLEDFDRLIGEIKMRGIRIIMDLDLNHTSDRHGLFPDFDTDWTGFDWIDFKDAENSVIAFARKANDHNRSMLCVCNFTPVPRPVTVVVARATMDRAG